MFKDPYLLDTLGLKDNFLEVDLENVILLELEKFILEFGSGFAFMERQKRIIVDGDDFKIDLLFYHRELRRLVERRKLLPQVASNKTIEYFIEEDDED